MCTLFIVILYQQTAFAQFELSKRCTVANHTQQECIIKRKRFKEEHNSARVYLVTLD